MNQKDKLDLAQLMIDSYRKVYYNGWVEFKGKMYNYYYSRGLFITIVDEAVFVRINKKTVMQIDLMHYHPGMGSKVFFTDPKKMIEEKKIIFLPWNSFEIGRTLEPPKDI